MESEERQFHIHIQRQVDAVDIPDDQQLQQWAEHALREFVSNADIGIRIVDNDESASLNQQYRKKTGPTNILSFPYDLSNLPEVGNCLHGDLVICAPLVAQEAAEQHKMLDAHWAHLITHGVLHLLGYDHIEDVDAEEMETLEIELLADLNYPNPYEDINPDE